MVFARTNNKGNDMDGLPTELVKLCHLASMAECGDHMWSGPAMGLWAAVWVPVTKRWADRHAIARDTRERNPGAEKAAV